MLFVKALSLDLACFDDPEFYNDFVWAMNESDTRAVAIIEDTGKLINRGVSSAAMLSLLYTIDPVIALILFLSSAVTVICNLYGNRIQFNYNKDTNELWRKKGYIDRVYHLADYAKELRTNHASELIMNDYDENMDKLIAMDRKYGIKYFLLYGLGVVRRRKHNLLCADFIHDNPARKRKYFSRRLCGKRERHLENPLDAD